MGELKKNDTRPQNGNSIGLKKRRNKKKRKKSNEAAQGLTLQ